MRKPTIEYTPEQKALLDEARRAAHPSKVVELTPEQHAAIDQAIDEEEAARPATIQQVQRMNRAEAEPGLSGQLRRAIGASAVGWDCLLERSGVSREAFFDFMEGVPVTSDVLDKLAAAIGCQLAFIFPVVDRPANP